MLLVALIVSAVLGGTCLAWLVDDDWPVATRLALGAVGGTALQGLAALGLAGLFGLSTATLLAAVTLALVPALLMAATDYRLRVAADVTRGWRACLGRPTASRLLDLLAFVAAAAILLAVLDRAIVTGAFGLGTGVAHNLGDLPFHLSVVANFAHGGNLPPQHPELAGARLTYPFLADFVAAVWVRGGADFATAFRVQNALLGLALLVLLRHFALVLTADRRAAAIVPWLVVCSGGLGFAWFFADAARHQDGPVHLLAHLTRDYTITPTGELRWGNALTTLLVPQRGWLLGLPLLLAVFALWWRAIQAGAAEPRRAARRLLCAGTCAGLLPLAHAHCFAVAVGVGACLAWLFPMPRAWRAFAGAALALALPQVLLLAGGSSLRAGSFLGWHVGWDRGAANPLWFWLVNTGLFLPLLAAALAGAAPRPLARFYSPFALLFVVPNLLRLSPWIWDNVKFLFPWYVASTPLVALLLARLSRKGILGLLSATLLFAALTLSGALDLWRVASRQVLLPLFDRDALAFAERVRSATPPGARLAHFPAHDAPALLAGRLSVLGYPGHIWSQGLDAGSREEELRRIYAGAPDAAELLARLRVGFLVLGPQERARYRLDPAWLARFPVVAAAGPYRLLDARATLNARGPATPR